MKSPFPGMDPYLEQRWGSVHQRLITYAADELQEQVPGPLRVRPQERVFVEMGGERLRPLVPDIYLVSPERRQLADNGGLAIAEAGTLLEEGLMIDITPVHITEGYVEIREAGSGGRVITVVEFLSPSNKVPGQGRTLYEQKQQECLEARVNLVEVNLVRRGDWVLAVPETRVPPRGHAPYQVCIWRGTKPTKVQLIPIPLRQRLPTIPIPLRPTDAEIRLDLQTLLDRCYHHGRYDDIDYKAEPVPPLTPEDAAWADELLRGQGLRGAVHALHQAVLR